MGKVFHIYFNKRILNTFELVLFVFILDAVSIDVKQSSFIGYYIAKK